MCRYIYGSELLLFLFLAWFSRYVQCFFDRVTMTEAELMFESRYWGWLIVLCYSFGKHLLMDFVWTWYYSGNLNRYELKTEISWWNTWAWNINEEEFNKETWFDYDSSIYLCAGQWVVYVWSLCGSGINLLFLGGFFLISTKNRIRSFCFIKKSG